ncbi:DUF2155 domain-containing protein [Erythrobacter tepidarius]|uniref:DUF2155 domain-containing protein n=1 Tax=Erythrobacter tepidarius TaxID=60454 RepID=UPI000A38FABB|nr:DUF2155 domain-containing protein [Erythrobacter tepidarius]
MGFARLGAPLACVLGCALALAACDSAGEPQTKGVPLDSPAPVAPATPAAGASDNGATPMRDRVATLGLLNKRNNVSEEITLKPGEAREIGPVIIRLSACERTAPWELPQEVGAFVQVDIRERGAERHRRVFSGWLFRESPSLNVVEHPVYDVWVKNCAMRWPGDADPSAAKSSTSGASPRPAASAAPVVPAAPAADPAAAPAASPAPAG